MTAPNSPLDALMDRIRRLLENGADAGVAERIERAIADFLAAFQLVPKREFDRHLQALQELEAQVAQLEQRVRDLEAQRN